MKLVKISNEVAVDPERVLCVRLDGDEVYVDLENDESYESTLGFLKTIDELQS